MDRTIIPPNGPNTVSYETWMAAIASSACIGFTSLVPWLFNLTFFEQDKKLTELKGCQSGNGRMKYLLSFAIGAILGDIFFHLIPESYQSHILELDDSIEVAHKKVGISIIAGIFMFIIVEMILEHWSHTSVSSDVEKMLPGNANEDRKMSNKTGTLENEQSIPVFGGTAPKDLRKKIPNPTQDNSNTHSMAFKDVYDNNNSPSILDLNQYAQAKRINTKIIACVDTNSAEFTNSGLKQRLSSLNKDTLKRESNNNQKIRLSDRVSSSKTVKRKVSSTTSLIAAAATARSDPDVSVDSAGYLNLIANGFDNFTHGLAIGASFLIGSKVGFLTTFVIIIHEIPHEICDYAILVNSGFSRWEAVKAQSSVSLFGIIGTATALYVKSVETLNAKTVWILPFSAGGFLYIALVNLLPEILDGNTDLRNTLGQVICVILGILFMALVAIV